jgi:hypothetical protein
MSGKRKLITSLASISLLAFTSVSVTYAWFTANTEAWVNRIGFDVTSGTGMMISVDGINYNESLTELEMKKAVVKKLYEAKEEGSTSWRGSDLYIDNVLQTEDDINLKLKEIKLTPVTSNNGYEFTDGILDGQPHNVSYADGFFISFDIYFKANYNGTDPNYTVPVYFNNQEKSIMYKDIDGIDRIKQVPKTSITSPAVKMIRATDAISENEARLARGFATYKEDGTPRLVDETQLDSGVYIHASDAMRFSTSTDGYATKIYEPNLGYGSYATTINSENDDIKNIGSDYYLEASKYDARKNAAHTYTQNVKGHTLMPLEYNELPHSYKNFDTKSSALVCLMKGNEATKATFTYWLEGWDADCFDTILDSSISVTLAFTTSSPEKISSGRKVTYVDEENGNFEETYYKDLRPEIFIPKKVVGKTFLGWYLDDTLYTSDFLLPDGDIVLKAKWI